MSYSLSGLDRRKEQDLLLEQREKYSIKDISGFEPNPVTRDAIITRNEASLKLALKSILRTRNGETLNRPDAGATIDNVLFEFIDESHASILESRIRDTINKDAGNYIEVLNVSAIPKPLENGYSIYMTVKFVKKPGEEITVKDFIGII